MRLQESPTTLGRCAIATAVVALLTLVAASPAWAVARSWIGAGSGGAGTDFNTGTNWNPNGAPAAADDLTMTITSTAHITLSASTTINSLTISQSGNGVKLDLDVLTNTLTINGTTTGTVTGGNANTYIYLDVGNAPGQIVFNGNASFSTSVGGVLPTCTFASGSPGSTGTIIFRGDFTCGTGCGASPSYQPANIIFDAPGTQTIYDNAGANYVLLGYTSTQIGSTNSPTVVVGGSASVATPMGNVVVNGNSTLDLGTNTFNRYNAGGTFTLNAGATMKLAGGSGGQTGSNFPSGYNTFALNAASTVEYNGTVAQTVFATPTYGNLTITNNSIKTLGAATTAAGTVKINSTATLDASTNNYGLTVGGDFTNSGAFTQRTGTVTLNGSSAKQTVGGTTGTTFYNLTLNNTSGLTPAVQFGDAANGGLTFSVTGTNTTTGFTWTAGNVQVGQGALTDTLKWNVANVTLTMPASANLKLVGAASSFQLGTTAAAGMKIGSGSKLAAAGAGASVNCPGNWDSPGTFADSTNPISATFEGAGTMVVTGSGVQSFRNVTISSGTLQLNMTNGNFKVFGDFINNATLDTTTNSKEVTFSGGAGTQTIGGTSNSTFYSLTLSNAATRQFGNNTSAKVFEVTGILTWNSGNVTVGQTSNPGAVADKLLLSGPATVTVNAGQTLTLQGGAVLDVGGNTATAAGVTIEPAKNLVLGTVASAANLTTDGNWSNGGSFTANVGLVTFNATTTRTIAGTLSGAGGQFYNLTFNGVGGAWSFTSNPAVDVANNLTITSGTVTGTSATMKVGGNWTNNGSFTHNGGTVEFNGSGTDASPQTINGSVTTFNKVTVSNGTSLKLNVNANFSTELFPVSPAHFYLPVTTYSWIKVP